MISQKFYPVRRREYFERKLYMLQKSLKWWKVQKPGKQYDGMTLEERCADIGEEIAYITDALNALEAYTEVK